MATAIGTVSNAQGVVTATNEAGQTREVSNGSKIFEGEIVSSKGAGSGVSITFNNGCNMTLGADESSIIDETLYKLEFFDDVDVLVDLDSVDAVVEEGDKEVVAEAEEREEDLVIAENEEIIEEATETDVDEIETAAGEEDSDSQVNEDDIDERIDLQDSRENRPSRDDSTNNENTQNTQTETPIDVATGDDASGDAGAAFINAEETVQTTEPTATNETVTTQETQTTETTTTDTTTTEETPQDVTPTVVANKATFVDSPVSGLEYESSQDGVVSFSGITVDGKFDYNEGDTVTYKIGGIELGSITMVEGDGISDDGLVFIQDLLGLDRSNLSDEGLISVARLIQTLDEDNDLTTIEISAETREALADMNITDLADLTEDRLSEIAEITNNTLISKDEAIAHLNESLDKFDAEYNAPLTLEVTPTTDLFVEGDASVGDVVATATAADLDGSDITYALSDDTYYSVDDEGTVSLTAEGAAYVNEGGELPNFELTAASSSGEVSSKTLSINPAATDNATLVDIQTTTVVEDTTKAGDTVATYSVSDEDTDDVTVTLDNEDGYYALGEENTVVLTEAGEEFLDGGGTLPEISLSTSTGVTESATPDVEEAPEETPEADTFALGSLADSTAWNEVEDGVITGEINDTSFTISASKIEDDSALDLNIKKGTIGVDGKTSEVDMHEKLTIEFDDVQTDIEIGVDSLLSHYNEGSYQGAEAVMVAYLDGEEVYRENIFSDKDNSDGDGNKATNAFILAGTEFDTIELFSEVESGINSNFTLDYMKVGSETVGEDNSSITSWGDLDDGAIEFDVDGLTGTITALNAKGDEADIVWDNKHDGLGIKKGGSNEIDLNESVKIAFDNYVSDVKIELDSLYGHFDEGAKQDASVEYTAYKDGVEVASGSIKSDEGNLDGDGKSETNFLEIDAEFDELVLQTDGNESFNSNFVLDGISGTVGESVEVAEVEHDYGTATGQGQYTWDFDQFTQGLADHGINIEEQSLSLNDILGIDDTIDFKNMNIVAGEEGDSITLDGDWEANRGDAHNNNGSDKYTNGEYTLNIDEDIEVNINEELDIGDAIEQAIVNNDIA